MCLHSFTQFLNGRSPAFSIWGSAIFATPTNLKAIAINYNFQQLQQNQGFFPKEKWVETLKIFPDLSTFYSPEHKTEESETQRVTREKKEQEEREKQIEKEYKVCCFFGVENHKGYRVT